MQLKNVRTVGIDRGYKTYVAKHQRGVKLLSNVAVPRKKKV